MLLAVFAPVPLRPLLHPFWSSNPFKNQVLIPSPPLLLQFDSTSDAKNLPCFISVNFFLVMDLKTLFKLCTLRQLLHAFCPSSYYYIAMILRIGISRLHSDATITTPRAASPAVVEARTSCLHQLSTLGFIFICVDSNLLSQQDDSSSETDAIPTPKVIIDQDSDPESTIVEITFGDRLGTLLDTVSCSIGLSSITSNTLSGRHWIFIIVLVL